MTQSKTETIALEKIVGIIDARFDEQKSTLPLSLMNGLGGLALFYYYYSQSTGKEHYREKANDLLNLMVEQLNSNTFLPLQNYYSYSTGLAGVAYVFSHVKQQGFADFDFEENFYELEPFFTEQAINDFNEGISDFLHGPMGVQYYLACQSPERDVDQYLNILHEKYHATAVSDQKGLRIKNMILEDVDACEYDLGLAHGLTGNLLVFLRHYEQSESAAIRHTIDEGLKYLLSAEKSHEESNENSFFPTSLVEKEGFEMENNKNYKVRLAWCYGDMTIAWLLIRAGKSLGIKELFEKGINIGLSTIPRKENYTDHQVGDAFICHGSSGVAYMYKRMYEETGNLSFYDAHQYWLQKTLTKIIDSTDEWAGNNKAFSILDGLLGVAYTLLPGKDLQKTAWDEMILMN